MRFYDTAPQRGQRRPEGTRALLDQGGSPARQLRVERRADFLARGALQVTEVMVARGDAYHPTTQGAACFRTRRLFVNDDPQTGAAPALSRGHNVRSRCR